MKSRTRWPAGLAMGLTTTVVLAQQDEPSLRRETGRLIADLVARRTDPLEEHALLQIDLEERGRIVDRSRRVEVSWVRRDGTSAMRVRFREPANLRDQAWLVRTDAQGGAQAWRWDPTRRRADRCRPLEPTWRLGGSGLTLEDLGPEAPGAHDWLLEREGSLDLSASPTEPPAVIAAVTSASRPVRVVVATPRAGERGAYAGAARRRLIVDAETHAPLAVEMLDAQGARSRWRRDGDWRWVQGLLRPFRAAVVEPGEGRITRVTVEWRRPSAPGAHFDPDRFQE